MRRGVECELWAGIGSSEPRASEDRALNWERLLPNDAHADLPATPSLRPPLALACKEHSLELVLVPAVGALRVEGHLPRGQHAALDGVNLPDELALSRQGDVAALEENLEVGGLVLLGLVGEVLGHHLREVAGEVHADAATVDAEARHGQYGDEAPQVGLLAPRRARPRTCAACGT